MTRSDFCNACGMKDWEIGENKKKVEINDKNSPQWLNSLQKRWDTRKRQLKISDNESEHDLQEMINFFQSLDIDGDGRINLTEFSTFVQILRAPDADVRAFFQLADLNHDETISYSEFETAVQKYLPHVIVKQANLLDKKSDFVVNFFGENASNELSYKEFQILMDELENNIIQTDFNSLIPSEETGR